MPPMYSEINDIKLNLKKHFDRYLKKMFWEN